MAFWMTDDVLDDDGWRFGWRWMTFWMMLDDGLDDIGRRLGWRVTFWITLDEGLDGVDDVLDDVLADGWRFRWRQEDVLPPPPPPPPPLTYLHIILMTYDGDVWMTFSMTLEDVGWCFGWNWLTFWMTLDDGWRFGWRMTFWMTLNDGLDEVGWRFGWCWMAVWMTLEDVLGDGYILDHLGWGFEWHWWRFGWRFGWRMTLDDVSDDGRKTFYHRRRRRRRWHTFILYRWRMTVTFWMTFSMKLEDVGWCFGWNWLTIWMTLDDGWRFGWRMTFWMTSDDGLDEVGWRFGWCWMTVWMILEDVLGDGLHFGLRWMRDWMTLMTFWMTFCLTDDVGWRFRWRQGDVLPPTPTPLTYLHIILMTDDGDVLNDVFDDVGRCWMMFWKKLTDVLDDVGWRVAFWMTDDVLDDVGWRFGWSWMTFWMMLDDGLDDFGRRLGWRLHFGSPWLRVWMTLMTFWMTFWLTDDVGWRFRWRQEVVLPPTSPTPPLTYLHIILMTDDGDVLNDVFDEVGRCWMMFWMKLIDVLDDVGWRMAFWMTDDVLDDVGLRFGWSWITFWMMLDDGLDDIGWCLGWRVTF